MKTIMSLCLSLFLVTGCNAQKKESKTNDTVSREPRVSWKVNKQYDEKGNVIGYDSTYSWSYSGKSDTDLTIPADSVMNSFRLQFNKEFPGMFNNSFGGPVWSDSLFYNDFLKPDYFMRKYQDHYFDMEKMMRSMDSMRNGFLMEHYPGINRQKNKL
jgi:hypothetical protein